MAIRKDWNDPELIKVVESLAAQGMVDFQIAQYFGVSRSTITRHKRDNAAFNAAIKSGVSKGIATITNALFVSGKNGNLGAQIFYLKNRAGWSDKVEATHTVNHVKSFSDMYDSNIKPKS